MPEETWALHPNRGSHLLAKKSPHNAQRRARTAVKMKVELHTNTIGTRRDSCSSVHVLGQSAVPDAGAEVGVVKVVWPGQYRASECLKRKVRTHVNVCCFLFWYVLGCERRGSPERDENSLLYGVRYHFNRDYFVVGVWSGHYCREKT